MRARGALHSRAHQIGEICFRDRQQSRSGDLCGDSSGELYNCGLRDRRYAHGTCRNDRSVASDDGTAYGGTGYELQAIAAVVIGGGSLTGGEGSVMGTLVGAFIMGLLSNGSDLLGISNYVQQVVIGAVIILAVAADELRKRRVV